MLRHLLQDMRQPAFDLLQQVRNPRRGLLLDEVRVQDLAEDDNNLGEPLVVGASR